MKQNNNILALLLLQVMKKKFLPDRQAVYEKHNTVKSCTVVAPDIPRYLEGTSEMFLATGRRRGRYG